MILIADSGSTKTDWRLIEDKSVIKKYFTIGLNPFFVNAEIISDALQNIDDKEKIKLIYFYGAGCINEEKKNIIKKGIIKEFNKATIYINDDITGAARALFKKQQGIAAILGTGMSVVLYNGENILYKGVSLGYILGDEGSGAYIGKQLLSAYLYGELPDDIALEFSNKYKANKNEILQSVYKLPFPNRYIADFTKFAAEHIHNKFVEQLVIEGFDKFFSKHIIKINNYKKFKIRLTGSIAYNFQNQIKKSALKHKLNIDKIVNSPIDELVRYHT